MTAREIAARANKVSIHYTPLWRSLRRTVGSHRSSFSGAGYHLKKIGPWEESRRARDLNLRASFRAGKLLYNIREEEKSVDIVFMLDATGSQWFGHPQKIERAAETGAGVANSAKKRPDPFTLIVFDDAAKVLLWQQYGKRLTLAVAEKILAYRPAGLRSRGLERAISLLPGLPSIVFFAADFLPPKRFLNPLARMKAMGHDVIPIVFRDRWEMRLPEVTGILPTVDAETGETSDVWVSAKNREQFLAAIEQALGELKSVFTQVRVRPVMLFPGVHPAKALNRHFLARSLV